MITTLKNHLGKYIYENKERDNLIKTTAIDGTQNIIDAMKKDAKIIFPSTHVIFEGLK